MKAAARKYLRDQSDSMIVSAIQIHQPGDKRLHQFKIYYHELKEGLGVLRLRDTALKDAISYFEHLGFKVVNHPELTMLRLTLSVVSAVFTPDQARLYTERCKEIKTEGKAC